ncbi:MAG: hypothetical protein ACRD96_24830 [Bryobacteraceae bacterium]
MRLGYRTAWGCCDRERRGAENESDNVECVSNEAGDAAGAGGDGFGDAKLGRGERRVCYKL